MVNIDFYKNNIHKTSSSGLVFYTKISKMKHQCEEQSNLLTRTLTSRAKLFPITPRVISKPNTVTRTHFSGFDHGESMNTVPLSNPVTVTQEIHNTAELVITFLLLQEKVKFTFCFVFFCFLLFSFVVVLSQASNWLPLWQ